MQIEVQDQAVTSPEIALRADSSESRRAHGGKRRGAGRKPNLAKRLLKGFTRDAIALVVEDLDVKTVIIGLLKSKSDRTRLETLAFLRDTIVGRPAQSVSVSGGLIHAHTDWRPLAELSDDELQLIDKINKKLITPVNFSQDGPHNQVNSSLAIEAEVMASDAKGTEERA